MTSDKRDLERALTRLGEMTPPPSEAELRKLARRATDAPRPTVAASRGRRLRLRWAVAAVAGALLVGSGLGFGLGNSVTPSGTASTPARGLGFLPAPGWTIVQGETFDVPGASRATAANVPLHPGDGPSRLPARTIAMLPARGVVIHVTFEARGDPARDVAFAPRPLPLDIEDAQRVSPSGYRLRAAVGGFNVEASIHFGQADPTALIAAAQRQLSRLTVAAERVTIHARPAVIEPFKTGSTTLWGAIDVQKADEVVDIQARDCGATFFRGRAGTTTRPDGTYETLIYPHISTTLRAVWNGSASAPVAVWLRAGVVLRQSGKNRFRVSAGGANAGLFWRKKVQIQRRTSSWRTVKTVVLTASSGFGTYFRLSVPRGSRLRAVITNAQAKPCYLGGVSPIIRS